MFYLNKKNCVSGGSLYCDFWKKDFGKPDLDYRYFYGPAETQSKFCGVVTVDYYYVL